MQFMNSSSDELVKNFSDNDFNYLSEEFSCDLLKLVRQKRVYPYEYILKIVLKINYLINM